jgi:hypothetical protein
MAAQLYVYVGRLSGKINENDDQQLIQCWLESLSLARQAREPLVPPLSNVVSS